MDEATQPHPLGEAVALFATVVLAPNPGPMTLTGTNSYVLGAPAASGTVVVDPGPADAAHLARLAAGGPVQLVLLTHHHPDHSEGLAEFARRTGAPVRAVDPSFCIDAHPLEHGERIVVAGLAIDVVATPGHTTDSVCFAVQADEGGAAGAGGAMLTGDTILGQGTSIIADPDGALGPYLASLERLRALGTPGPVAVLPGHGPVLPDLVAVCDAYLAHRAERLAQIRAALGALGAEASVDAVTDLVYADTDAAVRPAAEASVRAQLVYLRRHA